MKRITAILAVLIFLMGQAAADSYFILCRPGSEINVRERPKLKSEAVGCKFFGDMIITDGKEKNGFVHAINLLSETGDGWIYKGLLIREPPTACRGKAQVFNTSRVACRKYANGKIIGWLADGSEVEVYAVSEEWTVTDHGYIRTEFLTINAKVREPESYR